MDKIDRSFAKMQQMLRNRKMDLKKYYNINYEHEKQRIEKEKIPIQKDIIKLETIEKTWEKAINIIKSRSNLYLLKRLDYIGRVKPSPKYLDGFITSYQTYLASIYKGENFDLENFKLSNKLR